MKSSDNLSKTGFSSGSDHSVTDSTASLSDNLRVINLRGKGRLKVVSTWSGGKNGSGDLLVSEKNENTPRALRTLSQIIENDLCHRCGSCVGICPTSVLGLDHEEYPIVKNLSACTDCDLCVKVCPGEEFDAIGTLKEMFSERKYGIPDITDMHGYFDDAYLGYSTGEVRKGSTSGGVVSGLLLSLLGAGEIDGALVVVSDDTEKWKGKPVIARDASTILASMKSKYAIAPTNVVLEEIRKLDGRYAVVGLPCQIHGIIKASQLDKRISERIVLKIGLFCHAAVEHEPMKYLWSKLLTDPELKNHGKIERFISRVGKHPGTPHVEYSDGTMRPVYFPEKTGYRPSSMEMINILYRLYTPSRCLTCYDSTSEFADIAVGDPWMAPPSDDINFKDGYSFVLSRTEAGKKYLEMGVGRGDLVLETLDRNHAKTSNTLMGVEKRWRAFRVIETRRRQGKPIPEYHFVIPKSSGKHFVLTELNILSHFFCFLGQGRLAVLRFILSPAGYYLLRLNNLKREFRNWRRDTMASLKRRLS
ncbi:MAG TPA: Coenzyme F420 hydrogenase/dehydrogenase, beta subunit C-terminal domain [Oligoflexia bacterium]|nr:Coenzyme F420 hydrogenase/dehydrogenase, beta subunit C-terminal domain [Oligoflexia bacterium]